MVQTGILQLSLMRLELSGTLTTLTTLLLPREYAGLVQVEVSLAAEGVQARAKVAIHALTKSVLLCRNREVTSNIAGGVHHVLGTTTRCLCSSHHTLMAGALMASTRSDSDVACMLAIVCMI